MIRLAMSSVANTALFPLQDVLGLGNDHRMNVPGTASGAGIDAGAGAWAACFATVAAGFFFAACFGLAVTSRGGRGCGTVWAASGRGAPTRRLPTVTSRVP